MESRDMDDVVAASKFLSLPVVPGLQAAAMAAAGHMFHQSSHDVWLTDAVPSAFIDLGEARKPARAKSLRFDAARGIRIHGNTISETGALPCGAGTDRGECTPPSRAFCFCRVFGAFFAAMQHA
jgi:hypothetical protein